MQPVKERVLELLREVYPQDLHISEIARRLCVSRNTVAKYVGILEAESRIECRFVGKAKLCRARER